MTTSVLVVDDDAHVRDSVVAYLQDCGYDVLSAESAIAALVIIDRSLPDAIVCDLKMPGMKGIELLGEVKQRHPSLPFVIVSGAGVMDDVLSALRLGADDFLVKPIIDLEMLHHVLKKALERRRLELENQTYREHLERNNLELSASLDELRADQLAGRQAQMRMLPDPLMFNNIRCQHRLQPSLMLSGDFLDYFQVGPDQLAFYIADVSGHGASSAFVTVLLKNLTFRLRRNYLRGSSDDVFCPSKVLQRINSELLASSMDKHVTLFYGVLCTVTNTLNYSVAGHFPMPLMLDDRGAWFLEGLGMPAGMFKEAVYSDYSIQVQDNFNLMLFSDGILEIMPKSSLSDKEIVLQNWALQSHGDIESFWQLANLLEYGDVPDDIAVATISRGTI
ncbi:MAG: SpoIIE family protein phosphatase [Oleibacter sp.]|nr:SpoIIE family protein phosphatase [Thalassolituus sp.]